MNTLDLLQFCLERHRTSVALHRAESLYRNGLQCALVHSLHHGAVRSHDLDSPFHVDCRQLEPAAGPHAERHENDGQDCRDEAPESALHPLAASDAHLQSSGVADSHTLAAESTVYRVNGSVTE